MASGGTIRDLPPEVLEQLHSLDLELEEGDITKKGYEKKRAQLLQPFTVDDAVDDNTPDTSNATSAVNDDNNDESRAEDTQQAETMPFDPLDGEPSAADVTDFLDYLPSPTHSPTRPEVGAAFMEENHQQLAQQQQQQQQATGMEGGANMMNTQSPSSHSPPPPAMARPTGYPPWQQQQQQQYGYGQYYAPASPRPGYQYDPRMMSRPPYQQQPPPPQQQPRPMYGHYPGQQRPPPFARPAPPPPPPSNSPYTPRPMYNPAQPRPMAPPQQQPINAGVRPMYRPVPPQPRPMATYPPPPRPPGIQSSAPSRHTRTSSLESRSDANSMMQPPGSVIRPTYPMNGSHSDYDMQSRGDDWETSSVNAGWRPTPGRAPSIMSATSHPNNNNQTRMSGSHFGMADLMMQGPIVRQSSLTQGRSRYGNNYMATSFKAVEPAPQPRLMLDDPMEQAMLVDMAGRQLLPLQPRDVPFSVLDHTNEHLDLDQYDNLGEILRHRAIKSGNARNLAFTVVDPRGKEASTISWEKLNARAEKISHMIKEKSGLRRGERVALIYRKSEQIEFIVALLGCFLSGMVAVPINAAEELAELSFILNLTNSNLILTTEFNLKAFTRDMQAKSIDFPSNIEWWKTNDFGSWYPKKSAAYPTISVPEIAYIEYAKASNGELKGVTINHKTIMSACSELLASVTETSTTINEETGDATVKPIYNARSADTIVTYLEHRQQIGLIITVLWSIFSGSHTVFASSSIMDTPAVWIYVLSKYEATIALAEYESLSYATHYYQKHTKEVMNQSKKVTPDLSFLRFLFVDTPVINPSMNDLIANSLLKPLKSKAPLETLCPIVSLPEYGGMILAFRDFMGPAQLDEEGNNQPGADPSAATGGGRSVLAPGGSRDVWECLLDAESLKMNKVVVLATGDEVREMASEADGSGKIRVASFGFVMPEATVAIVDPETGTLCPPDTIGEIWVDAPSLSGGFWALPKHTEAIFHARPVVVPAETLRPEIYDQEFLRTGLVGTTIGGRLVVFGGYEDRIRQQRLGENFGIEEIHFSTDIVSTIKKQTSVDQCVAFDVSVNGQHMPIIACETGIARAELVKLAGQVIDVALTTHGLRVFAVLFTAPRAMPRHLRHGKQRVHPLMVKKAFMSGELAVRYLKMDVDRTVFNLASHDDPTNGVWRSFMAYDKAIRMGQIIPRPQQQHTGMESVREVIDERTDYDLSKFANIIEVLLWRTKLYPEETAYVAVLQANAGSAISTKPYSWRKINNKIAGVANYLYKKGVKCGHKALVLMPFGIEWIQTIYACMVLGITPVPFSPPDPQQHPQRVHEDIASMIGTVKDLDISYIFINSQGDDIMRHKLVHGAVKQVMQGYRDKRFKLPDYTNVSKASKTSKMLGKDSGFYVKPEWFAAGQNIPAIISVHMSADGPRYYATLGHDTLLAQCRAQKMTCQMKSQRSIIASSLGAYDGLGLLHYAFAGTYLGSPTVLLSMDDFYNNPASYIELLQRYKAKDVCATHPLLQYAMNRINPSELRGLSLQNLQNLMLVTEGRPKPALYQHMVRFFGPNRLEKEAVNTVYSHMSNPMITTRSYMLIEPISLLLDFNWLRQGIIRPLPMDDETYGLIVHDSGIVPSNTMVAIVNPETGALCPSHTIGEVWVASDCNVKTLYGMGDSAHNEMFEATITGGDPRVKYLRTGDLGFLWNVQRRVDRTQPMVEEGQCLFVLGSKQETIERNGLLHFATDMEFTVERCHQGIIPGGCIIFQANQEVVVVAAVKSANQALSCVPLIVSSVLENHSILVDTVAIIHSNQLPRTRFGDKQRRKAMTSFLEKKLPVIYVSRITNQHEPLGLPQWTQSQVGLDNDAASVISMSHQPPRSVGARSVVDNNNGEIGRSDSVNSQLERRNTSSTNRSGGTQRMSSVPASPAITEPPQSLD